VIELNEVKHIPHETDNLS